VNPAGIKVHADRMASEYGYDLDAPRDRWPGRARGHPRAVGGERAIITTPDYKHAEMIVALS